MPGTRRLTPFLALTGAALLASGHTAAAAPQDQSMAGMSMPGMSMGGKQPAGDAAGLRPPARITVYVLPGSGGLGFTGPDKMRHDTMVPSSFVFRKGDRVTVTVVNLDDMKHSITAPGLGINITIEAGVDRKNGTIAPSTTTYSFIPSKAGEFRWYCVFPCDMPQHWAMSASYDGPDRDGFMAGIIRVL
jgi:heme/copper-type cytochrome/quinol oxidase subunit 2